MQQDRTLVKDVLREFRPYCPAAADIDKSVNSIPTRGQIMPITSQNPKTSPGMATQKYSNYQSRYSQNSEYFGIAISTHKCLLFIS